METFELSILRLNSKSVSLLISTFVGEVFVCSFFSLDDISKSWSFALNNKFDNLRECTFSYVISLITRILF